jgi:hypothetical protein
VSCALLLGVQRVEDLAELAPSFQAFSVCPAPLLGCGPEIQSQGPELISPYLDRPLIPYSVALPQMLETIEAELGDETKGATEIRLLRQRAELISWLLTVGRDDAAHSD